MQNSGAPTFLPNRDDTGGAIRNCVARVLETSRDQELLARMALGDVQALAALYDAHAGRLFAVASRILGSGAEVEDLLHDLFLDLWQDASRFDPSRGTVRTWLNVRVRSRALDARRAMRNQHHERDLEALPMDAGRDDVAHIAVHTALGTLTQGQRGLIELAYFQGYTCDEMARRLDLPVGTVKSRLSAALRNLRHHFSPSQPNGDRP